MILVKIVHKIFSLGRIQGGGGTGGTCPPLSFVLLYSCAIQRFKLHFEGTATKSVRASRGSSSGYEGGGGGGGGGREGGGTGGTCPHSINIRHSRDVTLSFICSLLLEFELSKAYMCC